MKTTTKNPNELPIENSVVVLIDHQPWVAFAVTSIGVDVRSIGVISGKRSLISLKIGSTRMLPCAPTVVNTDRFEGIIEIKNPASGGAIDFILFGGEKYTEPIAAGGPFVMNTREEIALTYSDFHNGKYGEIDYSK